MDENRLDYFLRNEQYHSLVRQAEQERLALRLVRLKRAKRGPSWADQLKFKLAAALIALGKRLQNGMDEAGRRTPEDLPAYSYGD